jgi:DNA-binding MarR family transcriptional regulator
VAEVDGEDAARLRGALTRIARRLDRQAETGGLTRTQLWVLGSVTAHGPIGLAELAELEGLHPTMLSRVVGKLAEAGLLRRVPDPDDRRAARVEATRAGTRLHERRRRERTALLAAELAQLPQEQADALVAALPALELLVQQLRGATPVA